MIGQKGVSFLKAERETILNTVR